MIFKLPKNNPKQGQATLLAVLIITAIAVVTAVGVATRQQTSVRKTAYTSQTDQAFSCANSAVDIALGCIREEELDPSGDPFSCVATNVDLNDSDGTAVCNYTYTVTNLDNETINLTKLPKDSVQQFIVTGSTSGIDIDFSKFGPDAEGVGLEVTFASKDGTNYTMDKFLWYCGNSSGLSGVSGFNDRPASDGKCDGDNIPVPGSGEHIIRIRPYFSDASVVVSGLPSGVSQGYLVTSNGRAGTVQRNIEVMRMNPQLPALFDYVLYSEEGAITK